MKVKNITNLFWNKIVNKPLPGVIEIVFVICIFIWHLVWQQFGFVNVFWNTLFCSLYFLITASMYYYNLSPLYNVIILFVWPVIASMALCYVLRWIIYLSEVASRRKNFIRIIVFLVLSLLVLFPNNYVLKHFPKWYYVWGYF